MLSFFYFEISSLQMRNEKCGAPGCLGYVGDEKLPSCIGIMISHKDP